MIAVASSASARCSLSCGASAIRLARISSRKCSAGAKITRSSPPCMSGCLPDELVLRSLTSLASSSRTTASSIETSAVAVDEAATQPESNTDNLVQYVVLRRDLWTELGWPLGSIVAQACHASTAALWESRNEPNTSLYCAPEALDHMHKVVLEIKSEQQLRNLAGKLEGAGVGHKLWIEQPEDFATCLATQPGPKSELQQYFKKLKLCKGL